MLFSNAKNLNILLTFDKITESLKVGRFVRHSVYHWLSHVSKETPKVTMGLYTSSVTALML